MINFQGILFFFKCVTWGGGGLQCQPITSQFLSQPLKKNHSCIDINTQAEADSKSLPTANSAVKQKHCYLINTVQHHALYFVSFHYTKKTLKHCVNLKCCIALTGIKIS